MNTACWPNNVKILCCSLPSSMTHICQQPEQNRERLTLKLHSMEALMSAKIHKCSQDVFELLFSGSIIHTETATGQKNESTSLPAQSRCNSVCIDCPRYVQTTLLTSSRSVRGAGGTVLVMERFQGDRTLLKPARSC